MDAVLNSVSGLGNFVLYFGVSILLLFVFKVVYAFVTPHDEWALVKIHKNQAAAIGFGGAMIGFSIALAGAVANSDFLVDFVVWGVVAIIAQSFAFGLLRFTFMPKIADRIDKNEVSAGTILAAFSISVGLLNAACMSY
ncbi:MAG: putative membrane protein [Paraglaciecola sp.]|jgi:putative membrane protein